MWTEAFLIFFPPNFVRVRRFLLPNRGKVYPLENVRREGRASVSMLQRKLHIGYTRAARLVDTMEEEGIISPPEGNTQHRSVLDYGPTAPPNEE